MLALACAGITAPTGAAARAATFTATAGRAPAVVQPTFAIGAQDQSDHDFALAPGDYSAYASTFPNDVSYTVGTSTPANWSYIQPGPADPWAGSRNHTFTITFPLASGQAATNQLLQLSFIDTHDSTPPTLQVSANGHVVDSLATPTGGGAGVYGAASATGTTNQLTKPSQLGVVVPAADLVTGTNSLTITSTAGSWAAYDAVTMLPAPSSLGSVQVVSEFPTPLFKTDQGHENELVDLGLNNTSGAAQAVTLAATVNGVTSTTSLGSVPTGRSTQLVEVPPAPIGGGELSVTATANGRSATYAMNLPYQKRWQVDILNGSHLDIGYRYDQPNTRQVQDDYIDQAVQECQATANYPDPDKYRWTVEQSWVIQNYLQDRTSDQIAALGTCIRNDQIELNAGEDNNLQDLASSEQLIRSLSKGTDALASLFGVPVTTTVQDDPTGVQQQYIQMLAQQGVKLLINGSNPAHTGRVTEPYTAQETPALFHWRAPDGSSVLTFFGADSYPDGYDATGLQCALAPWPVDGCRGGQSNPLPFTPIAPPSNPSSFVPGLAASYATFLPGLQVGAYPQSVYPMDFYNDTAVPMEGISDIVRSFDQQYDYPRLVMSTPSRFYADATTPQGGTSISGYTPDPTSTDASALPTQTGDYTDWWSDGAGSSAFETGENMQAQTLTPDAETLGTLATLNTPDPTRICLIDSAYQEENLYTEHTWAGPALTDPDPDWPAKKTRADKAARFTQQAMASATSSLATQITNTGGTPQLAVFNPQSWTRTDLVTATVPNGWSGQLLDVAASNAVVPYQSLGGSQIQFTAANVPADGYRVYGLASGTNPTTSPDPALSWNQSTGVLKNQYYTLTISPTTGAITSLIDNATGRQLVDTSFPGGFQLNQYVYRPATRNGATQGGNPSSSANQWSPTNPTLTAAVGTLGITVTVTYPNTPNGTDPAGKATGVDAQSSTITLQANTDHVDLADNITKQSVQNPEEGYFAFPFKEDSPTVTYDVNGTPVQLGAGQIPGADMDNQQIGSYADLSNTTGGVTFASAEAPLTEFGGIHTGSFTARPGRLDSVSAPNLSGLLPTNGSVFSFVFNNLWTTNYRLDQSGPISYHYSITDHSGGFNAVAAAHFGAGAQSPLQTAAVAANQSGVYSAASQSLTSLDASNVVVQTVKQASQVDAAAHPYPMVFRLAEIAGQSGTVHLQLPFKVAGAQSLDLSDRPTSSPGSLTVAAWNSNGSQITVPVTKYGIISVGVKPAAAYYGGSPTVCETESDIVPNQGTGYNAYNYNEYSTAFPNDVTFMAQQGSSTTPAASYPSASTPFVNASGSGVVPPQWSYIQPGPSDAWAGSKQHTFTMNFGLCTGVPTSSPTLSLWLLDTQNANPPDINVSLNGTSVQNIQLPAGGGDGYHWPDGAADSFGGIKPTTENITLPAGQLRPGLNSITITTESGSWLVYDGFAIGDTSNAVTTTSANAPTDMAVCGTATQSSTYNTALGAGKAIDGNTDGVYTDSSLSHTNNDVNAWWAEDLGQSVNIHTVTLWNRTDCCQNRLSDFWVFTSATPFNTTLTPAQQASQPGVTGYHYTGTAPTTLPITQVAGNARYLMVQLNGTNYLSLAEVQVS